MSSPLRLLAAGLFSLLLVGAAGAQQDKADTDKLKKVAQAAFKSQEWQEAEAAFRKIVALDPQDGTAWYQLGYVLHAQKKLDAALKAHLKAADFTDNPTVAQLGRYNAACVYALKDEKDTAFKLLARAVDAGFTRVGHLKTDSDMDNLRGDPRFAKIVERMKTAALAAPMQVYTPTTARQSARLAYFGSSGSPGQLAIDYGAVQWNEKYAGVLRSKKFVNRRWRFGGDFWTSLDTNIPLTIAGVEIQPGLYYLTLTHKGDKKMVMNVLDPKAVRKQRLDPFAAHLTKGGLEVPLAYAESAAIARQLSIAVKVADKQQTSGKLLIRFGPHQLSAPVQIHLGVATGTAHKKQRY